MRLRHRLLLIGVVLWIPTVLAGQTAAPELAVGELTLEEKAALTTGQNAWETCAVPRLGIPAVWMADGPVGYWRLGEPPAAGTALDSVSPFYDLTVGLNTLLGQPGVVQRTVGQPQVDLRPAAEGASGDQGDFLHNKTDSVS